MTRGYTCKPRVQRRCCRLVKTSPAQRHYCRYVCPLRARLAMAALLLVIVLVPLACTVTSGVSGASATATYGAGQFHAQLTAQAEEGE